MKSQQRAAMQMALEALIGASGHVNNKVFVKVMMARDAVNEALREALAQPQGEWVDLTVDEIAKALNTADSHNTIDSYRSVIAKFKEKNTPPVVPQGEPVAWGWRDPDGFISDCICPDEHNRIEGDYTVPLYTTQPSVEAMRIETLEKAAKIVENASSYQSWQVAAAIRGME